MIDDDKSMLLRDPLSEPTAEMLKDVLGEELHQIYYDLLGITNNLGLESQWRYYNDGKAWLCKVVFKKKTIFWLSIWEGFVKTSFFFTTKTGPGIFGLPINKALKESFLKTDKTRKLLPLILDIYTKEQLEDFYTIAEYKKKLK